jgi:homoserine kinase
MNSGQGAFKRSLKLRLPATSANLGPGFDAAAVALDFYLEILAEESSEFSIVATGRNVDRCSKLEGNLILSIYRTLLEECGREVTPLAIRMINGIPLGMGCGSSAAGRLAAIAMAVHFGQLGWNANRILEVASELEGHPDNAAACWLGGFVTAVSEGKAVHVAQVAPPPPWRAIVVLPPEPLATIKARAVLPDTYSRADSVANIQAVSLLGLAFAQGRGDLLQVAMVDRIHQPYRAEICPMLPLLLPLTGKHGILGTALSGAGPAVLVVVNAEENLAKASDLIRFAVSDLPEPELHICRFELVGAKQSFETSFEISLH